MTDPNAHPDHPDHPDAWTDRYDDEAGPLVRLYAMTAGRARTANGAERVDLMAIVRARPDAAPPPGPLPPEQRDLLALCTRGPRPVADLASDSGLPLGVVRVLLGDLTAAGLIAITPPDAAPQTSTRPDAHLLREVIHGLRAL
ncbi:DUF742 domain-containing protein [Streptomyces cavernicola]|uniref:DUF742 domain-containing protein n=1 Tax=Streptomyces cavernicola TaxID=3043613 RepID=A0ABT6S4Y4_9ACTN|nr:DUF742 domain-containing protein [Streptomyces sp. B-S-A6]MDI3403138.1 DUF742 domain-containing protein [Streptomyces sp. B-S-A6]